MALALQPVSQAHTFPTVTETSGSFFVRTCSLKKGTALGEKLSKSRLPSSPQTRQPLAAVPRSSATVRQPEDGVPEKDAHKLFDQVVISVKAGDGGNGAVLAPPRPYKPGYTPGLKHLPEEEIKKIRRKEAQKLQASKKRVGSFKRDADGLAILPMGGHGGDVIIYADPLCATLLPLHGRTRLVAGSGGNVDGRGGLARRVPDGVAGNTMRIPVPVGKGHMPCVRSKARHDMNSALHSVTRRGAALHNKACRCTE